MILENQFTAEAVSPIPLPRNSTSTVDATGTPTTSPQPTNANGTAPSNPYSIASLPRSESPSTSSENATSPPADGINLSAEDKAELKRLHSIGIPVPGIRIKFDKYEAKVWLEDLEVECASAALRARVKAVVERGVETVSGLCA